MTVYFAVFGVGWIARLARNARVVAAAALAVVVLANTLGVGFGLGSSVATGPLTATYQQPGRLTLYANNGLWLGAPIREGDMLGLLRALRRSGVREVRWYSAAETEIEFSIPGIMVLARIAGLGIAGESVDPAKAGRRYAFLRHGPPQPGLPVPCTRLADGQGVWVSLGGSSGPEALSYCPLRSA